MWMEKLSNGVLCIQTALGPRYISPSFWQRFYLTWVFRNFGSLPEQVLSGRQRRLVSELCRAQNFITPSFTNGLLDAPISASSSDVPRCWWRKFPASGQPQWPSRAVRR
jgi:hypothetical protein